MYSTNNCTPQVSRRASIGVPRPQAACALRIVSYGARIDDGPGQLLIELHSQAGQVCFVELPVVLANAASVSGVGSLVADIESGRIRLGCDDRRAFEAFTKEGW